MRGPHTRSCIDNPHVRARLRWTLINVLCGQILDGGYESSQRIGVADREACRGRRVAHGLVASRIGVGKVGLQMSCPILTAVGRSEHPNLIGGARPTLVLGIAGFTGI
jgi:hypothetical protein